MYCFGELIKLDLGFTMEESERLYFSVSSLKFSVETEMVKFYLVFLDFEKISYLSFYCVKELTL